MSGDRPILAEELRAGASSGTYDSHSREISSGTRVAELDGMRGLAALSVVVAHYFGEVGHGLSSLGAGWVGVNLFFVLSGFLIGSIILERRSSPNFLGVFYYRRAVRILPIYLLTVSFTLVFLASNRSMPWVDASLPVWSYMTFSQNVVMAATGTYDSRWLLPTWTLAVEEQFYLLVPLLVLAMPSRFLLPAVIAGIAAGCGVRAALYGVGWAIGAQFLLVSRCDILLCGVLAALVHHRRLRVGDMALKLIALFAALGTLLTMLHYRLTDRSVFVVLAPILVAGSSAALVLLAVRGWWVLRPFRSAGWGFLGSISYGLYLIHQPVAGAMHGLVLGQGPDLGSVSQLAVTVAAMIASIGIAWASWRFLEDPLVRKSRKYRYR